ncbi:hypothetical protein AKUA2003_00170 [Apilactobacillus kunkeei]|uniref:hypothetical protein n=1 Tax=Apilactobacillus kunkeei TaxID=148814 RepID=UPI0021E2CB83|nr:hypothetical protein AKUA1001_00170 [Apilactobacillus kunkeei]CAI2548463.1 hypothetical protein AKUA2003_00170 [Apilactobacillus kunkeei]CAI2800846.1 hypothetical protein AKUA2002_00170 [Apilactobacillus kunkeei]
MMKAEQLIEQNNELRENLNPKNKKYYENLLLYIRAKAVFQKDADVETTLLEILNDLIDAQNNGQDAEDYFGKDPEQLASEIIDNLPKSFFDTFKLACYIFFGYIAFFSIPQMIDPNSKMDLGRIVLMGITVFLFALIILWLIGNQAYQKNKLVTAINYSILFILFLAFVIGGFLIETPLTIHLPGLSGILTIIGIFIISTVIYIIERKNLPFLSAVYLYEIGFSIIGIIIRIPLFEKYLYHDHSQNLARIVLIFLVFILIINVRTIWKILKRNK